MRSSWMALTATLLALTAVAGCLDDDPAPVEGPGGTPPATRIEPAKWNLTRPIYEGVVDSVHSLEAADGTRLSVTLHLPAGLPANAKVPTLMEITPYEAFLATDYNLPVVGTDAAGASWTYFVERGAAYVEADARGTSRSAGCLDFGGSADRADALAFVAWARAQPWSNGVVVTDGVSHPGMGSVVAHAAVADLDGALAHAPVVSYYNDEWYQGAKFEDQVNGPAYQAVELGPAIDTDPGAIAAQAAPCTGATTTDFSNPNGAWTDLWDDRDLSRHRDAAAAPILLTQGFIDSNVHPDHVQLYWDSLPSDADKAVIWGWWYHGWPDMDGHPAGTFEEVRHRWLDELLFGRDTGLSAEPRVLVEDSEGTWHEGHDWPLEPSEAVTLWGDGGALAETVPTSPAEATYMDRVGAQRGVWQDAHVAMRTEPMAEDKLVNGAPVVELVASSSATQTKWVVYLMDEAPDGSWQRVTHGYVDSHVYAGERTWQDLTPGQAYNWSVHLMPTAVVVPAGHRLTLVVASSDSHNTDPMGDRGVCLDDHRGGCYDPSGIQPSPSYGQATNTVLTGPGGTHVKLHWVDPALTAKVPWPA
ncbi:MAG TPA: CocE/NonD family hydrolase [Candidatus Thermoplasmatota archaeon]|nr:CocE/NonD family hydrolase [Candidatus Thermoplasmatota archaeon]